MKNIIYIILFLAVNFGFGQKNYAFNLYTSYGSTDREGNNSVYVTFSDTLNDQHTLRIFSKNDYHPGFWVRFLFNCNWLVGIGNK